MSVLIFSILCVLSGVGVYEWGVTVATAIKKRDLGGLVEGFWLVLAVAVGILAAGDAWSATGFAMMTLAALHQTFKRVVAWWATRR